MGRKVKIAEMANGEWRREGRERVAESGQAAPPPHIVYATVATANADDDDGPVVTMNVVGRSPSLRRTPFLGRPQILFDRRTDGR